jgi:uncharacterized protein
MVSSQSARISWADASGTGFETVSVTFGERGLRASAHVRGPAGTPFEIDYSIECDDKWQTRAVHLDEIGGRSLTLRADGHGTWTDGDGKVLPALAGAVDVDISATPFSNTLPIRRVPLGIGESIDIVTAYIAVPGLVASAGTQRYTRVARNRYRFESQDGDFAREITVDGEGFVLNYPGLFMRVPSPS